LWSELGDAARTVAIEPPASASTNTWLGAVFERLKMKRARRINAPLIAFCLFVLGGWGVFLYAGGWWWIALGLVFGLFAGDMVEGVSSLLATGAPGSKGKKPK
jgi:hypothetical protein